MLTKLKKPIIILLAAKLSDEIKATQDIDDKEAKFNKYADFLRNSQYKELLDKNSSLSCDDEVSNAANADQDANLANLKMISGD